MAIGSALVGVSYVMLAILAHVADRQPVNWLWLVLFFGVMTLGELYILPGGLSLFDRIAPPGPNTTAIAPCYSSLLTGNLLSGLHCLFWTHLYNTPLFLMLAGEELRA